LKSVNLNAFWRALCWGALAFVFIASGAENDKTYGPKDGLGDLFMWLFVIGACRSFWWLLQVFSPNDVSAP
jgi:hypothetical protein